MIYFHREGDPLHNGINLFRDFNVSLGFVAHVDANSQTV